MYLMAKFYSICMLFLGIIFIFGCSQSSTTTIGVFASPKGDDGPYSAPVSVKLEATADGAKIFYAIGTAEPATYIEYTEPVLLSESTTLRFYAKAIVKEKKAGIAGEVGQQQDVEMKSYVIVEKYVVTPTTEVSVATAAPTAEATTEPTVDPTVEATVAPTADPTTVPTTDPTVAPTPEPTIDPTVAPTATPTVAPTATPDTTPPGAFSITSPTGTIADTTPDISWQAATDAATYTLNISHNSNCSSPTYTSSGLTAITKTVTSALSDGVYYICVTAYDDALNSINASNNGLSFTLDSSAPPALSALTGGFGNGNSKIALALTYPANVSDYSQLILRRFSGASAPSDCASGTLVTTINSFIGSATVEVQDTIASGSGTYSYRACISDASGNTTSSNTVTSVKIRTGSHRTFVTRSTFGPKFIADYDSHSFSSPLEGADYRCQYAAEHATSPLSGKWKAILSAYANQAVVDRINVIGPISNINGDLVANSPTQFWSGTLTNAINTDENNATFNTIVWTGSNTGGAAYNGGICENWSYEISTVNGAWGSSLQTSSGWIYASSTSGCSASDLYSLYCIEQPLPNDLTAFTAATGGSSREVAITVDFPTDTTGYGSVIIRKRDYGYPAIACNGANGNETTIKTYNGTSVPFTDETFTNTATGERRQYYRACIYDSSGTLLRSEKVAQARSNGSYLEIMKTVQTYDGNMGGLTGADTKCQAAATAGKLGGTWKAVLSDESADVSARAGFSFAIPVMNFIGYDLSADSTDLFDGTIHNNVGYNEQISSGGYTDIFTGSQSNGTKSVGKTCTSWTNNSSGTGETGYSPSTTSQWLDKMSYSCATKLPIYCLRTAD